MLRSVAVERDETIDGSKLPTTKSSMSLTQTLSLQHVVKSGGCNEHSRRPMLRGRIDQFCHWITEHGKVAVIGGRDAVQGASLTILVMT